MNSSPDRAWGVVGSSAVLSVLALSTAPAFAAGSNMPWEQPLQQILQSVQGPVANIILRSRVRCQRALNHHHQDRRENGKGLLWSILTTANRSLRS